MSTRIPDQSPELSEIEVGQVWIIQEIPVAPITSETPPKKCLIVEKTGNTLVLLFAGSNNTTKHTFVSLRFIERLRM
jgi:hypothetical protein